MLRMAAALVVLDDLLKLFFLIVIGSGLLALGRWSSGGWAELARRISRQMNPRRM